MKGRQNLIFDGDDTLWENEIFYERAIESFIDELAHSRMSRAEVRAALDEIEAANSLTHGYGVAVFQLSLTECFVRLCECGASPADLERVARRARNVLDEPLSLLPGVVETLGANAGALQLGGFLPTRSQPLFRLV